MFVWEEILPLSAGEDAAHQNHGIELRDNTHFMEGHKFTLNAGRGGLIFLFPIKSSSLRRQAAVFSATTPGVLKNRVSSGLLSLAEIM